MSELTRAELAELRRLHGIAEQTWQDDGCRDHLGDLADEIPRLLDEIERLKQDARETLARRRMAIHILAEVIQQKGRENVEEIAARAAAEIERLRAEDAKWRELGPWWALRCGRDLATIADSDPPRPWVTNSREDVVDFIDKYKAACSNVVEYTGAENE